MAANVNGEASMASTASGEERKATAPIRSLKSVDVSTVLNKKHVQDTLQGLNSIRYQGNSMYGQTPWLDAKGDVVWSKLRIRMAYLVFSQAFETLMGLVIIGSTAIIMFEADQDAQCYPTYADNYEECPHRSDAIQWLNILNVTLLVIYSLECIARVFVERWQFYHNRWNLIDLVTVVLGWFSMAFAGMFSSNILRLSRLIRVVRVVRIFISVPEFYLLVTGLYSSIKAIFFGSLMLLAAILFWSVIAVEVLHPIAAALTFPSCDRCARGFGGVWSASTTIFQQIVAGDSWGQISLPILDAQPWTAPLLFTIMITISLGVMNLILAVIVERAAEARENDHERKNKEKEEERRKSMTELAVLCASLDQDCSGSVSLDEMRHGYDDLPEFKNKMDFMDIKRDEMELIFNAMNPDDQGNLSYLDFCANLGSFRKRDPIVVQSLIRCAILELKKKIEADVVDLVKSQHQELMREQRKLLGVFGLSAGPSLGEKSYEASARSTDLLRGFERVEQHLDPLMEKTESLLAEIDSLPALAFSPQVTPEVPVTGAAVPLSLGEGPEVSSRSNQDEEAQYAALCLRFQAQLERGESLHSRLRKAVHDLQVLGNQPVQPVRVESAQL